MGHHFVPQFYLSGFSVDPQKRLVWLYDRKLSQFSDKPVSIKGILQPRNFYSEEDERKLAELIEKPANAVLRKLRVGDYRLTNAERSALSLYMLAMTKRVPSHRERAASVAPRILEDVASEMVVQIHEEQKSGTISTEMAELLEKQIHNVASQFQATPPPQVVEQIESPWPSFNLVSLVHEMHWQLVSAPPGEHFVSSDNPMFYFRSMGLGTAQAEFTFPVSSHLAIFGFRSKPQGISNPIVSKAHLRESNRRIIHTARRFIVCNEPSKWIDTLAQNSALKLNVIRWQ